MAEEVLHGDFVLRDGGHRSTYQPLIPRPAPTASEVVTMVDETAKSVMRAQGRDPAEWDALPNDVRDRLRLQALDRLRRLA